MSGVFGCWHRAGRPLNLDTFHNSLERLSPPRARATVWHNGPIALGHKSNWNSGGPTTPQISRDEVACVFDGRLDNRDELLRTLGNRSLHCDSHDCDFVRAAYRRYGEHFAAYIKGDFICAVFDAVSDQMVVARDRLGVRPVCFTSIDDTFLFASEAKALLAWPGVSAAPDDLMMADFLLQFLSQDSQNRTFFRDIRSLPPAHVVVVTRHGVTLRRYFDFDTRRAVRFESVRGYVDAGGTVHRSGSMRLATARDELVPLRDDRVRENPAFLTVVLLGRVVTRIGTVDDVHAGIIENLFASDLAFLQDLYRRINQEGHTRAAVTCPSCSHEFAIDVAGGRLGE